MFARGSADDVKASETEAVEAAPAGDSTPAASPSAGADAPAVLLFAQHGWADTNRSMLRFGQTVATPGTRVIAPNLGYVRTWLRMEPLIAAAERVAAEALDEHPGVPIRIAGHSMGGLIWIELLARHPEWRARTDRLVLIGCPVAGAQLARILDPFGLSIARDLRADRRGLAEAVADEVPTLSIVGDLLGPHDGTVSHESARLRNAPFVLAPASSHAGLRRSRWVALLTRSFFERGALAETDPAALVERIRAIPGIQTAEPHLFRLARIALMFADGTTVRLFDVMPGVEQVFVADREGRCLYAGSMPRPRRARLRAALHEIARERRRDLLHPAPHSASGPAATAHEG
jgi:pimeloyl-ACP methyl ester carboxylesterase